MVVAAYGLILPREVLALPRRGCINIHASLLPRWRGAAPIQRALLAGDRETGISIMQMDAGLDTGPVLLREAIADRAATTPRRRLHDRLAALGARLIVRALAEAPLEPQPQDDSARDLRREDRQARSAHRLARSRRERSSARCARSIPVPGAATSYRGVAAQDLARGLVGAASTRRAGQRVRAPTRAASPSPRATGALRITELQRAGGKRARRRGFPRGLPR